MTAIPWVFDLLLALTLVVLSGLVLATADLFRAVVLFIALGLLMALAWVRLDAVDLALAEAAIGAGLTGALFLNALAGLGGGSERPVGRWLTRVTAGMLVAGLIGVLGIVVLRTPGGETAATELAYAELPHSEVGNPVTAVLLNFRGYDTLLEIGVLLLALAGVRSLAVAPAARYDAADAGPVLVTLVRILMPLIVLVAAYLLWVGTKAPGGAFQAGAILSAGGVLLVLGGVVSPATLSGRTARVGAAGGLLGFLAIAVGVMVTGNRFLEYPRGWAGVLILFIESVLTLSIAVMLAGMFVGCGGGRPNRENGP